MDSIVAERRHVRPIREVPKLPELYGSLLNGAPGFRDAYLMRPGSARRQALLTLFLKYPEGKLPVNNRYQANTLDPDLCRLLKRGVLKRIRGGGGRHNPMNRKASKRQTYLMLA